MKREGEATEAGDRKVDTSREARPGLWPITNTGKSQPGIKRTALRKG